MESRSVALARNGLTHARPSLYRILVVDNEALCEELRDLFDWLDRKGAPPCDRTARETKAFLAARGLDEQRVIPWLQSYGGYCDCEVLANVESTWGDRLD